MSDYRSVLDSSEGVHKEKGSKFLSYLYPVSNETDCKKWVDYYKENQSSARHHCYAYRLGAQGEVYRTYDDGEPGGTAGKPILNQLLSNEITDVIIIIVRYFGGTKLGVSGLITAYKEAAKDAIKNAEIIEKFQKNQYHLSFTYEEMPSVMKWTKQNPVQIIEQDFNLSCILKVEIRENFAKESINALPFGIVSKQIE